MTFDVAVVGGGIAGLSCAWELLDLAQKAGRPLSLVVLEASDRVGGKLQTQRDGSWVVEAAADGFLTRKKMVLAWIEKLSLTDRLISPIAENRKTYIRLDGSLHALPEGFSGLVPVDVAALRASTLLSPQGLERMLAEEFLPSRSPDQEETLEEFFRRRFGDEAFERLYEPLLSGISSGASNRIGMESAFGHFVQMEREEKSILRTLREGEKSTGPGFQSLKTGMSELVEALAKNLAPSTRLRSAVRSATFDGQWRVELSDRSVVQARSLVLATPATVSAEILAPAVPELSKLLAQVEYTSVGVLNFRYPAVLEESLPAGTGYLIGRKEGLSFSACTWSSRKWPGRAPKDGCLVRFYCGKEALLRPRKDLFEEAQNEVERIAGKKMEPVHKQMVAWKKSVPVLVVGHKKLVGSIDEIVKRIPTLALCGSYFEGVGIPDTLNRSQTVAQTLFDNLNRVG